MKGILSTLLLLLGGFSYGQTTYQFYMNLNEVKNDRLKVTLLTPIIKQEKIVYNVPKIVPGTYHVYDFGQYVNDFEALDKEGKKLIVTKLDDNRWEIESAKKLHEINYWVEDTWDAEVEDFVFEPAGTNIEEDTSFMINTHGFFGYFDGMKNREFELNITRPANFYGSTGISGVTTDGNTDKYKIKNYMGLVDAPIMYNEPDTTFIKVGETDVLISVYSKNKSASAVEIAEDIQEVLEAQRKYLGGTLPVKKYAFIIHLYDGMSKSGASGALEHSYSSVYFLPEMSAERLSGFIIRIAAHEFFHIVTPLNIHSEQIGNFDYINPEMSKHLWLWKSVV